ncbi:MAG: hypothetical protein NT043_00010 [Candidatus Bathyarchaeota archaeon]|nr:hypothetical protein [Candidatus Bathyarchaeota archaeon]
MALDSKETDLHKLFNKMVDQLENPVIETPKTETKTEPEKEVKKEKSK